MQVQGIVFSTGAGLVEGVAGVATQTVGGQTISATLPAGWTPASVRDMGFQLTTFETDTLDPLPPNTVLVRYTIVGNALSRDTAPAPVEDISPTQLFLAAAAAGIITQAEAEAAASGAMPDLFADAVAGLPSAEAFAARVRFARMQVVERANPLIAILQAETGMTSEQVDDFFRAAKTL